ncbi:MAG: hypothetical protein ACOC0A_01100 [Planctomycetota bacterium]
MLLMNTFVPITDHYVRKHNKAKRRRKKKNTGATKGDSGQ